MKPGRFEYLIFILFGVFHIHRIWGLIDRQPYTDFWLGLKLAGAVCDFTEPATGQNKLFFPVV